MLEFGNRLVLQSQDPSFDDQQQNYTYNPVKAIMLQSNNQGDIIKFANSDAPFGDPATELAQ